MARPERNNVDYFPFLCKEGKAMFCIEQKYGNDGYATWIKILRQLAVTNNHYLNLNDKAEFMFLSSKCKISELMLNEIIKDLCDLGEFNSDLWVNNKIVFSEKFIASISDAYLKRNNKCISLLSLFHLLDGLGIRKLDKSILKCVSNTQSKEDYIKEEESKLYISISPFVETYGKDMCRKFYEYWSEPNKSKTKLKYQMERTWDISKRIKRWSDNNFNKDKENKQDTPTKLTYSIDGKK